MDVSPSHCRSLQSHSSVFIAFVLFADNYLTKILFNIFFANQIRLPRKCLTIIFAHRDGHRSYPGRAQM